MIDYILARRSIQWLEKKKQTVKMIKKRNEEKVCLEKMLQELQLEKKSFRHDFKVSPRDMENKGTLQNQIHSTMECLPELEARVQNLREECYREDQKKLRPYVGESLSVGAETYQLRDMKMVQELLGEMVEDLINDYIIHVPQDIQPECEKDKRVKILEEMSFERAVQLIMEELVLEVTKQVTPGSRERKIKMMFKPILSYNKSKFEITTGKKCGNTHWRNMLRMQKIGYIDEVTDGQSALPLGSDLALSVLSQQSESYGNAPSCLVI
ncbi:unnamed protein product [Eretmochelys imbricata]